MDVFSQLTSSPADSIQLYLDQFLDTVDTISVNLMSMQLSSIVSLSQNLHEETYESGEATCSALGKIQSRRASSLSPEKLSMKLKFGLSTARRVLEATTHESIQSTGVLTKRFKTDRTQLATYER